MNEARESPVLALTPRSITARPCKHQIVAALRLLGLWNGRGHLIYTLIIIVLQAL